MKMEIRKKRWKATCKTLAKQKEQYQTFMFFGWEFCSSFHVTSNEEKNTPFECPELSYMIDF